MKHLIITSAFLLIASMLTAQAEFTIDTLYFKSGESMDSSDDWVSAPYITFNDPAKSDVALRINQSICRQFGLGAPYLAENPKEYSLGIFQYLYELYFDYHAADGILFIKMIGFDPSSGRGGYHFEEHLYFDLETGEEYSYPHFFFSSFFTKEGYWDFFNKYWYPSFNEKLKDADACWKEADPEWYEEDSDFLHWTIDEYIYKGNKKALTISTFTYPDDMPYIAHCYPYQTVTVSYNNLREYLNNFGKKVLIEDGFLTLSRAEQCRYYLNHFNNVENTIFLKGTIGENIPISFALSVDSTDQTIEGYYYYDKHKQKIKIRGGFNGDHLGMSEYYANKNTGHFNLTLKENNYSEGGYFEFTGEWLNPDASKKLEISIETISVSRSRNVHDYDVGTWGY